MNCAYRGVTSPGPSRPVDQSALHPDKKLSQTEIQVEWRNDHADLRHLWLAPGDSAALPMSTRRQKEAKNGRLSATASVMASNSHPAKTGRRTPRRGAVIRAATCKRSSRRETAGGAVALLRRCVHPKED